MRILTGVKPTWDGMHIGNYLWMFRPFKKMIETSKESFLFIPDFHSLTSVHNAETLRSHKKRLVCELLALLSDKPNVVIFEQSKITHINDINRILSSVTPYSLMLRAHTFKDREAKNSDINMATFNYPILMAADIISYDVDLVPVWKDQKQHVEFARDIAENFNRTYDVDFFKLPNEYIQEDVGVIPWTDGRKMSKSYDNFIGVFDDEKTMKKKIMSIVTDDTPLEAPKNPDTCNVYALIKFFASNEKLEEVRQKYLAWWYWYGHAKLELLSLILEYFKDVREKYNYYMNNYGLALKKLEEGNVIANGIVNKKYEKLKEIIGL